MRRLIKTDFGLYSDRLFNDKTELFREVWTDKNRWYYYLHGDKTYVSDDLQEELNTEYNLMKALQLQEEIKNHPFKNERTTNQ